jgi:hypothetical protein
VGIVGVTDRAPTRLVIGSLHKGERKLPPGTRAFPKDLPGYFRFESPFPDVVEAFARHYGPEPREILCMVDGADTDQALDAWYELYNGADQLTHRCDGQHVVYQRDERGKRAWVRGEGPICPWAGLDVKGRKDAKGCSQRGRLKLIPIVMDGDRPRYARELGRLGIIVARTTSIIDIGALANTLNDMMRTYGELGGIPFTLRRFLRSVPMPDGAKDRWMLDLLPDPRFQMLRLESAYDRAIAALSAPSMAALAAGDEDDDDPTDHAWREQAPPRVAITAGGASVEVGTGEVVVDAPTDLQGDAAAAVAAPSGAQRPPDGTPPPVPDDEPPPEEAPPHDEPTPIGSRARPERPTRSEALATPAQVRAIYMIGRDQAALDEAAVDALSVELHGVRPAESTSKQASATITALKQRKPAPATPDPAPAPPGRRALTAEELGERLARLVSKAMRITNVLGVPVPVIEDMPNAGAAVEVYEAAIRQQLNRSIYALENAGVPVDQPAPEPTDDLPTLGAYHQALVDAVARHKGVDPRDLAA